MTTTSSVAAPDRAVPQTGAPASRQKPAPRPQDRSADDTDHATDFVESQVGEEDPGAAIDAIEHPGRHGGV